MQVFVFIKTSVTDFVSHCSSSRHLCALALLRVNGKLSNPIMQFSSNLIMQLWELIPLLVRESHTLVPIPPHVTNTQSSKGRVQTSGNTNEQTARPHKWADEDYLLLLPLKSFNTMCASPSNMTHFHVRYCAEVPKFLIGLKFLLLAQNLNQLKYFQYPLQACSLCTNSSKFFLNHPCGKVTHRTHTGVIPAQTPSCYRPANYSKIVSIKPPDS